MSELTPDQIQDIAVNAAQRAAHLAVEHAAARAAEQASMSPGEIRALISEAVKQTLIQLGVDAANPLEMQRDFQHLRQWRTAQAELKARSLIALTAILLSGTIALIILGFKEWTRKG